MGLMTMIIILHFSDCNIQNCKSCTSTECTICLDGFYINAGLCAGKYFVFMKQ